MRLVTISRWDNEEGCEVFLNRDDTITSDPEDAELWDDDAEAKQAAHNWGGTLSESFQEEDAYMERDLGIADLEEENDDSY